jgi:hypothetical protein
VSLVLEALKKLDREKGRDERGFLVMAAAPWPQRAARRWPAWAAAGVAAAGAVAALLAVRAQRAPAPAVPIPAPTVAAAAPERAARAIVPPPAVPNRVAAAGAPRPSERTATPNPPEVAAAPAARTEPAPRVAPTARPRPDHGLRLQAVSERDGQPIAIVNDHLVRVGDEVEGMRVLAIRATEVDVEIKGRRITLAF